MKDKRGHERGPCSECECEEYEPEAGSNKCDFCGHCPVQHNLKLMKDGISPNENHEVQRHEAEPGRCQETPGAKDLFKNDLAVPQNQTDPCSSEPPLKKMYLQTGGLQSRLKEELKMICKDADILQRDGKYFVLCKPCEQTIAVGDSNKWGSLRRHMTTSATHIAHIKGSNEMDSQTTAFAELTSTYKNIFIRKGDTAVCRDCKQVLSLTAKNIATNANRHMTSNKHTAAAQKASSSKMISQFFTKNDNPAQEKPTEV